MNFYNTNAEKQSDAITLFTLIKSNRVMQENSTPSSDLQQLFRNLAVARVFDQLNAEPLWRVTAKDGQVLLYERSTGLLWDALPSRETKMDLAKATEIVTTLKLGGLQHWRVPTLQELKHFAAYQKASIRSTQSLTGFHTATECWLTTSGTWTFDTFVFNEGPQHWGILSAVNDFVGDINDEEFIDLCLERDWALTLSAEQNSNLLSAVKTPSAPSLFADVDYLSARLPRLEDAYFKDPTRGLWELWGHDQKSLQAFAAHARNPADDVVDWDVAIDFGTSSTVVAYNEHGRRKLLRVGMDRFWEADQPEHYENPTALE
ncbi:MAG: Lcl domain-containing protein, partial [Burkholderiales bacterium]